MDFTKRKGVLSKMTKSSVKKFTALLLSAMMLLSIFIIPTAVSAAEKITVNIHYSRSDNNYENWNLWIWADGKDGQRQDFTGEDSFGKLASFEYDITGVEKIGFIVRQSTAANEWAGKDTSADRFIETSKAKDGKLDIYVNQGQKEFGYSESELGAPRISTASLVSSTQIDFTLSQPLDTSDKDITKKVVVKDSTGKAYAVKSVTPDGDAKTKKASLTTSEELPFNNAYTLSVEGYLDLKVSSNGVYGSEDFESKYKYDGDDLGATYTKEKTTFKVWAPLASATKVNLYKEGSGNNLIKTIDMKMGDKGVWSVEESGDLNGTYYTYSITTNGKEQEAVDLYARAGGVNGQRGMVIDLASTNPDGWDSDTQVNYGSSITDAVLYEEHVRDFSIDESSGMKNKGKYLAFTETGTKNSNGDPTGVDYLKDLGITHIQLQPSFDYASVDETKLDTPQFNWGYDPENYNFPEGSYSTDPTKGEVRVNEFKQMVKSLHDNNIGVVMDVVYNHTAKTNDSNFNKTFPEYYYRLNEDGSYSNGSGCGNETASERAMVRKYIVDSVVYWATEYHIDGFRFDLMGIHDIETMKAVREALDKVNPNILVYGEGWTGGDIAISKTTTAMKVNISQIKGVAAFSDDIRDGLKGNVFNEKDTGFVSGKAKREETVKSGVVGATAHPQVDYATVASDVHTPWAADPTQTINYVSCHDNNTLWDRFLNSCPDASDDEKIQMTKLTSSVVFTSQGIPFILSGEEILRTKPVPGSKTKLDNNSYKSPDSTNSIKWDTLSDPKTKAVYEYYKGLIAFRKAHPSLRLATAKEVADSVKFSEGLPENVVAYEVSGKPNGETADSIFVAFNANKDDVEVKLPSSGKWSVCVNGEKAGTDVIETVDGDTVKVAGVSAVVLVSGDVATEPNVKPSESSASSDPAQTTNSSDNTNDSGNNGNTVLWIIIGVVAAIVVVSVIFAVVNSKKKGKND